MSLNVFLNDFNTVNKLIIFKQNKGLNLFESIKELISDELLKEGITSEMIPTMDITVYNNVLKSNLLLSFLHSVNIKESDDKNYVILKYNTRYARFYKHSKYARSLVLNREADNIKIISYGFTKFYNLGEKNVFPSDVDEELDVHGYGYMVDKLDGTNITARFVSNEILINTTGSLSKTVEFYKGEVQINHILEAEKILSDSINDTLMIEENTDIAFIYEMIGIQQIIVNYDEEFNGLHLIGARKFLNDDGTESRMLSQEELENIAMKYNVRYVTPIKITKVSEALDLVNSRSYSGKEGVVVYVGDNIYKIKSDDYVLAHHLKMKTSLKNNDDLKQFIKIITPLVINDTFDDYVGVFKGNIPDYVLNIFNEVEKELDIFNIKVLNTVESFKDIDDKEFFKNINSLNIPIEYKSLVGAIRKETNYKGKLINIISDKLFKNLKE